jgi:hypothetical protein
MAETIQRSFTSGEISPSIQARADLVKYTTGLARCENFIVRSQGGVYSRPGTRFIGEVGQSDKRARLIPFEFNTEQTYVLVFEHLKMRVIKDGGFVLDGAGPALFELATPYTEAQLSRISFTQSADTMTICHPSHAPRNLTRMDHDDWALNVINYAPTVDAPSFVSIPTVANITDIILGTPLLVSVAPGTHSFVDGNLITIDGITGSGSGSMADYLNGNDYIVGAFNTEGFYLVGTSSSGLSAYTSGGTATRENAASTIGTGAGDYKKTYSYIITAVDENGVESLPSAATSITTESLSTTAGVRLQWSSVAGADYYRVYKDPSVGTDVYGWIGDSKNTSFDDYNIAPLTSDAPPQDRQPLSGADNYPACVTYYQQRQVLANTNNEPQTVFTTQTANYKSFRVSKPTRDDDAVTFAIASRQVNEIRHLVSLDALIMLTSNAEWRVTEGQDQVLTPSTIGVRVQSYNGASWVPPVVVDDTVIYVQSKGTKLRDLKYNFGDDKYSGNDLSIMAEHLFKGYEIEEITYSAEPYGIAWCVRNDGVLLGLTYQREHQVWAWHKHITDGVVESVTTISEGDRDATYMSVRRTINGVTKRYVERIEPRYVDDSVNAFCVDSGLTYSGSPASTITGLDHLEGKDVAVLADGSVVKDVTVTGGQITIPFDASVIHIGLPYTPVIETLDLDAASMVETLKAKEISVSKVTLQLQDSRGGYIGALKDNGEEPEMSELIPRDDDFNYDVPPLRTYKDEIELPPEWNKGGGVRIEQRDPLPMAVLAVIPELDISA